MGWEPSLKTLLLPIHSLLYCPLLWMICCYPQKMLQTGLTKAPMKPFKCHQLLHQGSPHQCPLLWQPLHQPPLGPCHLRSLLKTPTVATMVSVWASCILGQPNQSHARIPLLSTSCSASWQKPAPCSYGLTQHPHLAPGSVPWPSTRSHST